MSHHRCSEQLRDLRLLSKSFSVAGHTRSRNLNPSAAAPRHGQASTTREPTRSDARLEFHSPPLLSKSETKAVATAHLGSNHPSTPHPDHLFGRRCSIWCLLTHVSSRPAARLWAEATAAVAAALDDATRGFWGGDAGLLFGIRVGTEPPGALQARGETTVTPPCLAARTPQPADGRKPPRKQQERGKQEVFGVNAGADVVAFFSFYDNFGINKHCRHSRAILLGHYTDVNHLLKPHNVQQIQWRSLN